MPNNASPVLATPDEIVALCREFPEAPIMEITRHAIAHGTSLTRERLAANYPQFHSQR